MDLHHLIDTGALFSLLVFWHFVADWLFQSHDEAMKKSKDARIRMFHCLVYTLFFVPIVGFTINDPVIAWSCLGALFLSHFIEDTYYPVLLWAKHVRKPPEFDGVRSDEEAFIKWASQPLGKIIAIVVDQLVHIGFLLPIAWYTTA